MAEWPKGSIAICQNPAGEGTWWHLSDNPPTPCLMSEWGECCKPKVFVPASRVAQLEDEREDLLDCRTQSIERGDKLIGVERQAVELRSRVTELEEALREEVEMLRAMASATEDLDGLTARGREVAFRIAADRLAALQGTEKPEEER